MKITASTPLYGVMGNPIRQSLSPILQNGWIAEHGFDGVYIALPVPLDGFAATLTALHNIGLKGANVTMPFKEQAAASATSLTPRARAISSVNCLTYDEAGDEAGFLGDSTDGAGLVADLNARAGGWAATHRPCVLIGAGGAARAILQALVGAGVTDITLVNRDQKRAREAAAIVLPQIVALRPWDDLEDSLVGAGLVINATSAGFQGVNPLALDVSRAHADCIVYDSIYAPRQTALLASARAHNRLALDGLGMLVGQGALAFQNWFGVMPDLKSGLARLESELAS